MINYAKILLEKEKDSPSKFLRATYLFSNVGSLVHCYGRCLRFPQDAHIYEKETMLALGDIIMQCRMYMEENNQPLFKLLLNKTRIHTNKEMELAFMSRHAAAMLDRNEARINHAIQILTSAVLLCHQMNLNFDAVEHLGFIHVCERFEQFEREGWQ